MRLPILLLIVLALWWFVIRPSSMGQDWVPVETRFAQCGADGERETGCVIDGDTVVIGFSRAQRRIRLTGYDAPELDGACTAEREAAQSAQRQLRDWLNQGPFEWSGGAQPPRDQYGRELRDVRRKTSDGQYDFLSDWMIDQNLAGESGWGAFMPNWCG